MGKGEVAWQLSIDESACRLGSAHNRAGVPFRTLTGSDLWPGGLSEKGRAAGHCCGSPSAVGQTRHPFMVLKVVVNFQLLMSFSVLVSAK